MPSGEHGVNDALVERNYLVYRPHEAFKGAWDERAQSVNDMVLRTADVILNLTLPGVPSLGTDAEMLYAANYDPVIIAAPPPVTDYGAGIIELMAKIEALAPEQASMEQDVVTATLVMVPTNHWMLPPFLKHHSGSPLRVHYYDEHGHVQARDVDSIVPGDGSRHARIEPKAAEALELPHERMLKIEVLGR